MNNDLISREALKEEVKKHQDTLYPLVFEYFEKIIDNAPTVEPICPYLSDDEVKQPCLQAPCERPQGKWVKIFENPFTNGYVCPFCGHKIQVTEKFLPEVTECESCGADMR